MSITKREQQILQLLEKNEFLTVRKLAEITYTSESSIRRDLTHLQNKCLVRRTHGGVLLCGNGERVAHLRNRMEKNIVGKRKIAKKAAKLLCDNQIIMLDGSTTAGYLVPYIAKHKNIVLYTNNMITAMNAVENGIDTHCIGGSSVKKSAVLSGEEAYRAVKSVTADILFFSSQSLDEKGIISDSTAEENYLRSLMMENARKTVFLCDSEKFGLRSSYILTSINNVDCAVFDCEWEQLKSDCIIVV